MSGYAPDITQSGAVGAILVPPFAATERAHRTTAPEPLAARRTGIVVPVR
jgi:hypothetical protein